MKRISLENRIRELERKFIKSKEWHSIDNWWGDDHERAYNEYCNKKGISREELAKGNIVFFTLGSNGPKPNTIFS